VVGGGATHAWMQVFLPGAGWVEFDPTNALAGGRNLIRVAVARDAAQAAPLTGSFTGAPEDFLGMTVDVTVTAGSAQQNQENQVQNHNQNQDQEPTQSQSQNQSQNQIQTQTQSPAQSTRLG
jgi:hypothetical protein